MMVLLFTVSVYQKEAFTIIPLSFLVAQLSYVADCLTEGYCSYARIETCVEITDISAYITTYELGNKQCPHFLGNFVFPEGLG